MFFYGGWGSEKCHNDVSRGKYVTPPLLLSSLKVYFTHGPALARLCLTRANYFKTELECFISMCNS